MPKPAANAVRIACLVLLLAGWAARPASGYTLVDWIRTWPASAPGAAPAVMAPAAIAPAVVPSFSAPAPSCGAAAPSCAAPAPACDARPPYYTAPMTAAPAPNCGAAAPAAPVAAGVSYLQPAPSVAVPAPQVRYRTTWVRTPTTNYRPIVTYDPVTGWPTTIMQPCTTYTWQLRRVPSTGQGGWLSNVFGNLFGPRVPPPAQPVGVVVPPTVPTISPGWSGAPAPAVPTVPAYPAPTSVAPSTPYGPAAPLTSPPLSSPPSSGWTPSNIPSAVPSVPGTPTPAAGAATPGASAPADRPPALSPGEAQGLQNLQPLPENRNYPPASNDGSLLAPPPLLNPSKTPAPPAAPAAPAAPANVSPVPDPDAGSGRTQVPAAPSLYDPEGRTARVLPLGSHWPAAPIRWSEPTRVTENPAIRASGPDKPSAAAPAPDADGWQAVRP